MCVPFTLFHFILFLFTTQICGIRAIFSLLFLSMCLQQGQGIKSWVLSYFHLGLITPTNTIRLAWKKKKKR